MGVVMVEENKTVKRYWYVRHNNHISGPYSAGLIKRQVLLGRIKKDDEFSHDQIGWKYLDQLAELMPAEMMLSPDDPTAKQRLLAAQRWADDRDYDQSKPDAWQGERRHREEGGSHQRRQHNHVIADKLAKSKRETKKNVLLMVLIISTIAAIMGFYFSSTEPVVDNPNDCSVPAGPGVDWSNCFMQGASLNNLNLDGARMTSVNLIGADLSHTSLIGADLSYSLMSMIKGKAVNFSSATMVGVNLNGADLRQANLSNTDLSYANLSSANISGANFTGAKLDKARWVDGNICAIGSIGHCKPLK